MIAIAAWVPALLLWRVEGITVDLICNRMTGSAAEGAEVSQHIAILLIATAGLGFVVPGLLLIAALISRLFPSRPEDAPPVRARVITWIGLAILAAGIATAFFVRSSALHDLALRGSCAEQARSSR